MVFYPASGQFKIRYSNNVTVTLYTSVFRRIGELPENKNIFPVTGLEKLVCIDYILTNVIDCLMFSVCENVHKKLSL